MKNVWKFGILALTLVLGFSLIGCGSGSGDLVTADPDYPSVGYIPNPNPEEVPDWTVSWRAVQDPIFETSDYTDGGATSTSLIFTFSTETSLSDTDITVRPPNGPLTVGSLKLKPYPRVLAMTHTIDIEEVTTGFLNVSVNRPGVDPREKRVAVYESGEANLSWWDFDVDANGKALVQNTTQLTFTLGTNTSITKDQIVIVEETAKIGAIGDLSYGMLGPTGSVYNLGITVLKEGTILIYIDDNIFLPSLPSSGDILLVHAVPVDVSKPEIITHPDVYIDLDGTTYTSGSAAALANGAYLIPLGFSMTVATPPDGDLYYQWYFCDVNGKLLGEIGWGDNTAAGLLEYDETYDPQVPGLAEWYETSTKTGTPEQEIFTFFALCRVINYNSTATGLREQYVDTNVVTINMTTDRP